jgi:flagellar basal body-associated protein FliL
MKGRILKIIALVFVLSTMGVAGLYLWKIKKSVDGLASLPEVYNPGEAQKKAEELTKKSEKHMAAGEGHGGGHEEGHGEGHGEAKAEGGEHGGGGEHGEAKAEGGEHGGGHASEAKAEGHGEGHGEGGHEARKPASKVASVPVFSVDELFVNVTSEKGVHMMGLKLDLELFEEGKKEMLKSRQAGIRDRIIELSREFDYEKLQTLGGKLYFKELIVTALNEFFGQAIVKNAHISSFYLQ